MITVVIDVLAPILLLGLIGYVATRTGHFEAAHRDGLAKYVFDFAVPMLLFSAVVKLETPAASAIDLFLAYYGPLWLIFGLGFVVAWRLLGRPLIESMVIGLGSCFSNTVLLGIPLIPRALGDEALFPLFLLISIHGITVFTVVTVIIEVVRGRHGGLANLPKQVASGLIANPLIVGLGLGFLWKLTELGLHPVAEDLFDLVSTSVTPAALFVLGSSLAGYALTGSIGPAVAITALKNAVHPIAVWVVGQALDLDPLWLSVAVLLAAMPTGMNMYLFANRYQVSPATATTSIFASTVSGILTISLVILALKHWA